MTEFDALQALGVPVLDGKSRAAAAVEKLGSALTRLRAASGKTDTAPTAAQKESGRYRKGRFYWKGLTLVIETPKGAVRSGVGKNGTAWSVKMRDHYGYVAGTEGRDGDAVDVFLCEDALDSELVFVVNQRTAAGGFDEHKVVLGCTNLDQTRTTYLRNYSPGWAGMGEVTPITLPHFKWWLENVDTKKEVKNGYFAAAENRKPMKKAAADPMSGYTPSDPDEQETFDRSDDEAALEQAMAKTEYLNRYECPNCGGTNLLNGDPKGGVRFRGSGHCADCDEGCSIVGLKLKPVGRGPALEWSEERKKRFLKGRALDRRLGLLKTGFDAPVMLFVKRADDDNRSFTIAIDLDGTLAKKEEPFDPDSIGDPIESAVAWVRLFHQAGARIIIFTVRGTTKLVRDWLDKHDVPFDFINENPDQPEGGSGKVLADVYWDDRAYNAADPHEHGPEILRRVVAHGGEQGKETGDGDPSPAVVIAHHTVVTITGPSLLAALEGQEDVDE